MKPFTALLLLPLFPFLALGDFFKAPYVGIRTAWMIWCGYKEYVADGSFDFKDIQDYFFSSLFSCIIWYLKKAGIL